jgi:hypothetical protein
MSSPTQPLFGRWGKEGRNMNGWLERREEGRKDTRKDTRKEARKDFKEERKEGF